MKKANNPKKEEDQTKKETVETRGRKRIELNPKIVENLASIGLPLHHIANIMDVAKSTLDKNISENDEIKQAILKGRSNASKKIYETAYNLAVSGNVQMLIFWLKCRERWKEDSQGDEIAEETLTPQNLNEVRAAARKYLEASEIN